MAGSTNSTPTLPDKDPAVRFKTVAERRVARALEAIKMLDPLTNTANYTYTAEQAERITGALSGAVEELAASFARGGAAKVEFTL